jgi:hypothetical protein
MQRLLRMAILLPSLALLPMLAVAQDTKDTKKDAAALEELKLRAKVLKDGAYIQGKLTAYDNDERKFTVQYVYQKKATRPNPEVQKEIQKLAAEYRQAIIAKDKKKVDAIYAAGVAANARLYDVEEIPLTFEFVGDKNMIYRTLEVPLGDDGKPKKLSADEQKKLGVDPRLPGIMLDPKMLDVDMTVRVYLDKTKPIPDPLAATKKPDPPKTPEKKPEEKKPEETKPTVKVVTSTKKPEEKKPEEKKPEEKKPEEKSEKLVYPTNMIVVVPQMQGGGGAIPGGNPFTGK